MSFSTYSSKKVVGSSSRSSGMLYPRAASVSGMGSSLRMSSSRMQGLGGGFKSGSSSGGFMLSGSSSSYSSGSAFNGGSAYSGGFAIGGMSGGSFDEKQTMQDLNTRLASYLENVRSLESSNKQLELKIKEYYNSKGPSGTRDTNLYYQTIADLHRMIIAATIENSRVILQIDNAKLTADDFGIKYNSELVIRQGVESDIEGLRRVLDELTMTKSDLEMQIERLKEELIYIRKNHEEELKILRSQLGGTISVDVEAKPKVDLVQILTEMRQQYELLVAKNRKEAEDWFKQQVEVKTQEVVVNTQAMDAHKAQLTELRRTYQNLQLELQSLMSMNASLEGNIQEIEARYGAQFNQFQMQVSILEKELIQIRNNIQQQAQEYSVLLNIKTKLEMEIATYRRLLDGESSTSYREQSSSQTVVHEITKQEPVIKTRKKVVTLMEQVIDGKVVSTQMEEVLHDN
uniref:Keratin, type I cytoskeletal 42 n=1 Tax=Callorhinchus milii TaxID=7868 RepID=K4G3P3_CALMI|nr:keratin, type I cytoskeletal 42 [Callorhinchus milii]|eukprot:gi/632981469/ref/XP_007907609.1/ PREDICTED: keratin, type I cytoskeletal 19-like [Callorhinchus milii]